VRTERQIALAPDTGPLYYLLGKVHQARRDWTSAEKAFRRSVELEPYLADAYVELGRLYATSNRYEKAVAELDNAVRAHPKGLAAHMLLGALHQKVGYFGRAQKVYEEVLVIEPGFPPAAGALALLYADHTGNLGRALQLAQAARVAAPDDPRVAHSLGWVLYKLGHYEGAVPLLRESLARLPDDAELQFHLGMAALKTGDPATARRALTGAIRSPDLDSGAKREAAAALQSLN
ncbi:MAG: tetratricopeptide repeat protein, partial [Candidatus Rokuibacteriota bacterium]